jgi:hypothetical protein
MVQAVGLNIATAWATALAAESERVNAQFLAVESAAFPGAYLYMTGRGDYNDAGTGRVAGQYWPDSTAEPSFPLFVRLPGASGDGAAALGDGRQAIMSISGGMHIGTPELFGVAHPMNPGVFLRMDGQGITEFNDAGAGTVNCQVRAGAWESFRFEPQPGDTFAIASVAFPGIYLRMDGRGIIQRQGSCGGTVNCQFGVGPWEQFRIHPVKIPVVPQSLPS